MKHGTPTSPSSSSPNPAFALRPPSHMNKSQRHSRALSNTDVIESMTVSPPRPPNPISAEDEPEKTNGSSAVSPRFMALRKLSEASMVSTGRKQSVAKPTSALESFEGFQNQLLRRIDDIIDGQLQSNLAQLLWKATQTQLDTRRFWEDQKKEMMEYSSNMLAKLQPHAKPPRMDEDRAQLAALQAQVNELKQENSGYRRKQIGLERELYEMNMIKARNVELERQCALVQKRNATLDHQYQEPGKSITETVGVHDPVIRVDHDYDLLLARNHELEAQIDRLNERIRDLESECTAAKQSKVSGNEDRDTDPLNETVSISDGSLHRWADEVNRVSPKGKTTTTEDSQVPDLQPLLERIASLEEENKHLRQMEDIHRIQIEHLQHPPAPAPAPTVKVREEFKDTIVVPSSNPKRGHNKQHRRSMPPRFPTRSMPVSRVSSPNTNEDGYSTDGEVLTFLTEINGQISRFTVKLPQHQSKESSNDRKRHTMNAKSRLNPHAPVWPAFE
ncbi:uncharacterized protein BYT42DRAFT_254250 [Radiomyces spectabilis]|uniref:uncharacterized protein n=1 Tax=Radiomyces spectabilis TaxID=64574 RepID=UPI00222086A4|nr:uncharacterized protein BYT42DRAFT_254250 [Radiomyces spectabilis]KAI8384246.1 hypothetical protein BYT42DRAFT_254250 [Radiomyces spectabilis]